MIHLMANNKQPQLQYQCQTQPAVPIPTQFTAHNQNNNNKNNKNQKSGKRQKRDDDWDICWDYLSPKGCNRNTCRWRHDNPQIDQQQIAKRRKRYMEQGRRDREMRRARALIGGPNRNRNKKRKRNNSNDHNMWHHMPPPYFPPAPPQIAPPQQPPHDYYAQYYHMQPPQPPQPPPPPHNGKNNKNENNKPVAYGYPGYGGYPYSPYPYLYPSCGFMPPSAPNKDKDAGQKQKQQIDEVKEEDKEKNVEQDDNEAAHNQDIDMNENEVKQEIEETDELVFNDDDDDELINDKPQKKENEKEKEEKEQDLEPLDDPEKIAEKVTIVNEHNQDMDANRNELQPMPQGAGKKPIVSDVNSEKGEDRNNPIEFVNDATNTNKNETNESLSPSPPRHCASDCQCDICCYKQTFQATPILTAPHSSAKKLPARHPMFDGMEFNNISSTNPWTSRHKKDLMPHPPLPQPFANNTNTTNALEYNLPKPSGTKCVFTTDPETGGLVSVPASSVSDDAQIIAATTLEQQQLQSHQILQKAQQQALCAQQQLQLTVASLAQNNLYYDAATGQYMDLLSGAINTPTANPMAAYHAYYAQLVGHTQNNVNNPVSASTETTNAEKKTKTKKTKKNKKKGIHSCVKWLYIISDTKRECYGSLCRGQFDSITTTKWLTSLYEEAEWGNGVRDRSRGQSHGPTPNHIAWYTLSGCNCSLNDCIQDDDCSNVGFPSWLQQIASSVMKICSCEKDPPNCAELFFFENKSSKWNWHSYCEQDIFGINTNNNHNNNKSHNKHRGQTVHLWIGHKKQFKFAPRRTKAIPGDEEKSIYLENGDVFVTCGQFTEDYVVKIDCEEDLSSYESSSRAHSSMYIVWRWIINHNPRCLQKDNV